MVESARSSIVALLGPTNTGKTHRAIERMLEHESGMLGLPLRLLAREVYDRVTAQIGEREVALVTGEEKRVGPRARYWICTVEAMPRERQVDFVGVDEVQLASHPQRGHVFTERLEQARGARETWFMGAQSMEPLLRELVPTVQVKSHPRLSRLRFAGQSTLAALPARSAVVAFSATRVYELAERIRQKHGGAAVVLGALSPRARNAQVALYQAGEVDYMVATDAIGMGLNLDITHVAFADLSKFDGRESRALEAAELSQIAGRAGRYLNDGTFGTLAPQPPLGEPVVRAIESHRFPRQRFAWWRSTELDFSSIDALIASLATRPRTRVLRLAEQADDLAALCLLARREEIRAGARSADEVRLLWDVCRIPDYRGLLLDYHVSLLGELFAQLRSTTGRIEADWARARIERLNDVEGDIDTLLARLSFIRTWTYVSYQSAWLPDAVAWQERTRAIEDRLSDALHERLVARFVDKRASGKPSRSRPRTAHAPAASEPPSSAHPFGKLLSLRDELVRKEAGRLEPASDDDWLEALIAAPHERFSVDEQARILEGGRPVAKLMPGSDVLRPEVAILLEDIDGGARLRLPRRLIAFARDLALELFPAFDEALLAQLSPAGRGLVYQLRQGLGTIPSEQAAEQIRALTDADRRSLERASVRFLGRIVYIPGLLEPVALTRRAALWRAYTGEALPSPSGLPSLPVRNGLSKRGYAAVGYPVFGQRAVRADLVSRVQRVLRRAARRGRFRPPAELARALGCAPADVPGVIRAFGYRALPGGYFAKPRARQAQQSRPFV